MFCSKCGNELVEGAKFCNKCGTPVASIETAEKIEPEVAETKKEISESVEVKEEAVLENAEAKVVENKIEEKVPTQSAKTNPKGSTINLNNKMIAAVIAVVAIIIMFAVAIKGCGKKSSSVVDLSDYFTVEFSGVNGAGKADFHFDKAKMDADWDGKLKFKGSDKYPDIDTAYINIILRDVGGSMHTEPYNKLSNGDVVKLDWNHNDYEMDELNSVYNCSFVISEKEFTVEGLKEVEKEDAFASVGVEYEGTDGQGTATVTGTMSPYRYEVKPNKELSNGDIVTVSIVGVENYSSIEAYANESGKMPAEMEKTFIVEGLQGYLTTLDGIDESAFDDIKKDADNFIKEETSSEQQVLSKGTFQYDMDAEDYAGKYLLVANNSENSIHNKLLLIYKKHFNIRTLPRDQVTDLYVKILKDVDTDFNIYIGVLYDNVVLEDGIIQASENSRPQAVSHKYEHIVEEEVYDSGLGIKDLRVLVQGYDSIEEMLEALKNEYNVDYTFEEKLDEGNSDSETASNSDSDAKYVLTGEYEWTYDYGYEFADQILSTGEEGIGVDRDDYYELLPEMEEKLTVNNIELLKKWGYNDKELEEFKKSFLVERYVRTQKIEKNVIDIIDNSFGHSTDTKTDTDYFAIVLNDNLPMLAVSSRFSHERTDYCVFDFADEEIIAMKIKYSENSAKNISNENTNEELHLGTYENNYYGNEKFILYKGSNGELLADYEHPADIASVYSGHLTEHNDKRVPVSVIDKDTYLIGKKGVGDSDKLELIFDGDKLAILMEYEAVEFTKIK